MGDATEGLRNITEHPKHPLKTPQSLGFYMFDSILRQRGIDDPQAPLIAYPATQTGVSDYELFTGEHLNRLIDGACKVFLQRGFEPVYKETIIGILGASDLDYIVNVFALGRIGYTAFLLSPRLSPYALAKLLDRVKSKTLIFASQLSPLARKAAEEPELEAKLELFALLTRAQYDYASDGSPPFSRQGIDIKKETKKRLIMIHSSGSTGLPKPAHYTNDRLLATLLTAQQLRAFQSIPLFHAHGFITLIQAIWTSKTLYLFNGHVPQTHATILEAIRMCEPEIVYTVPYVLKLLVEGEGREEGSKVLRQVRTVSISGSKCPDELGDLLVKEGVWFGTSFGATEVALILTSLNRPREDTAWNYLRPPPHIAPFLVFNFIDDGPVCECVVLDGHRGKMTSNSDDPLNSYYTSDLFIAHPTIPNAWKFVGRLDDRITLTNGEKVLPLAIEGGILQESVVSEVVVFGVEREVPGLLLFRAEGGGNLSEEEFLNRVWPAIEDANSRAEGFSQIGKEMVIVLPPGTKCPITDKSSIKRAQVYRDFAAVIDSAYNRLQDSKEASLVLEAGEMEIWIVKAFQSLGVNLADEKTGFFSAGVDSLKAIQMRGLIVKNLDMKGSAAKVPSMVVYDCGNTEKLARRLVQIRDGLEDAEEQADEIAEMQDMIEWFSTFCPRPKDVHANGRESPEGGFNVVLLTGATGNLGMHILTQLMERPSTSKIYCAVRQTRTTLPREIAQDRVDAEMRKQGFFTNDKLKVREEVEIVCLFIDLSKEDFGLPEEMFTKLRNEVTNIIHCAWNVNFVLPVKAFEEQVEGLRSLVNFSLSSPFREPPRLLFCSSVGVAMATPRTSKGATVQEAEIKSLTDASPTGYARSKLVAERILKKAVEEHGAVASILRIGQIVPSPNKGTMLWNPEEMIPLIVRSAIAVGVLPDSPGPGAGDDCSWIDVGTLASTVLEIAGSKMVYNLVSLHDISWKTEFLIALKNAGLVFEMVSWKEWLEKLKEAEENDPSRRLLSFWEENTNEVAEGETKGAIEFDYEGAKAQSETFASTDRVVDNEYVKKLLHAWKAVW